MTDDIELVSMSLGAARFGVPVLRVRDVLDMPIVNPVPLAPSEIVGSINLRGRIVTAIDLRARLGLPARDAAAPCMCVIVESAKEQGGEPYAFLVDEVGDVLSLPASLYEPNPVTLSKAWAGMSRGLYRQDGALLLVLDVDAVLDLGAKRAA